MDDMRFCVLFNSISAISGQWAGDNGRLCATKARLRLKRSPPQAGLEPGNARLVGQRLIYRTTGASTMEEHIYNECTHLTLIWRDSKYFDVAPTFQQHFSNRLNDDSIRKITLNGALPIQV